MYLISNCLSSFCIMASKALCLVGYRVFAVAWRNRFFFNGHTSPNIRHPWDQCLSLFSSFFIWLIIHMLFTYKSFLQKDQVGTRPHHPTRGHKKLELEFDWQIVQSIQVRGPSRSPGSWVQERYCIPSTSSLQPYPREKAPVLVHWC